MKTHLQKNEHYSFATLTESRLQIMVCYFSADIHQERSARRRAAELVYTEALLAGAGPHSRAVFLDALNTLGASITATISDGVFTLHLRGRAAVAQNRALGTGFCIDPIFWAQQLRVPTSSNTKLMDRDWGNFRRSRFPFYHETYPTSMNPFDALASGSGTTPRMFRVSLHDPNSVLGTRFKAWLRLPGAIRLATVSSTDVTKVAPEKDRSAGALRLRRQLHEEPEGEESREDQAVVGDGPRRPLQHLGRQVQAGPAASGRH